MRRDGRHSHWLLACVNIFAGDTKLFFGYKWRLVSIPLEQKMNTRIKPAVETVSASFSLNESSASVSILIRNVILKVMESFG